MTDYVRALPQTGPARPDTALSIAGGRTWFTHVEVLRRGQAPEVILASNTPDTFLEPICAARTSFLGLDFSRPNVMGILNVTPDSFSDGGQFLAKGDAAAHAMRMIKDCELIDVGGESTRPGAAEVSIEEEIARTQGVIATLSEHPDAPPISIDTRKSEVARAALVAGAGLVNDVSAFTYDPNMAEVVAESGAPVCLMHAQGAPENMQTDPRYTDVLLDVYDHLAERIKVAEAAGIARNHILVDPGIGFGKTLEHNLTLLHRLSLFHSLGCPILLGASRKRFIGALGDAPDASDRVPGSIAVALTALGQGVQMLRVHDTDATRQAVRLWEAITPAQEKAETSS